jgi:glycosyltransferase involved in cell wall biosynthesis/SAM-dependent methyltransferase
LTQLTDSTGDTLQREDLIRQYFDREMKLLELGPSHRPIIAKADGWQTTIVDHADQAELIEKYSGLQVETVNAIEPVDHVWQGGTLVDLLPKGTHGTFDGIVASHVGEHIPDLIGFFRDAAALCKPSGMLALALPDKRSCFDFFQPMTLTGDVVDAHVQGRTRHARSRIFNHAAYFAMRGGESGWPHSDTSAAFALNNSIGAAQLAYDQSSEDPDKPYSDCHAWIFTPKSFELLMLELNLLGYVEWAVHTIEERDGVEFLVWLERKRIELSDPAANQARLSLLTAMTRESAQMLHQVGIVTGDTASSPQTGTEDPSDPRTVRQQPAAKIAVIIPLYNGAPFIEEALRSVFAQTLKPNEIVVVDDGSTDDGVAIVERLSREHPVTLYRKENGGQSSARNFGVRNTTSDFIAFLDQDDAWRADHLQVLAEPFKTWSARPIGWTYSNLDEVDESGMLVCRNFLDTMPAVHPKKDIYDCIRHDMFVLPSAALVSRAAFNDVGGFDERLCGYEDDDLFLRIFVAGYQNVYLNVPLSKWRIYSGSTSYSPRMAQSRAVYVRKLLQMFPDDLKRARYYRRDIIAPRFLANANDQFIMALQQGDLDAVTTARGEVAFLGGESGPASSQFIPHLLTFYKRALERDDPAMISEAWQDLHEASRYLPQDQWRLRRVIDVLRFTPLARAAFAARRIARPAMLWAFSGRQAA